ncbi:MAG: phosphodiester glycosidase family protein [Bacteroidales bacterium]|nr:phosphodiester glycosidase family protein [Bacteroidales bacterium]
MRFLLSLSAALLLSPMMMAQIQWHDLGKGAQVASFQAQLFNSTQSISVLRYPAKRLRMRVVNDPGTNADSTGAMAARHNALAAVNGSYFNMRTLEPVTYVKEKCRVEGATTPGETFRTDGLLAIRGRKVDIIRCDTLTYSLAAKQCPDALASGPVLLLDGWEARDEWPQSSFYTKRHPRTFVGTTNDGWVYLVVIDGRAPGKADGATIHETALIARLLGLDNAINLDGGGSSTLWTRERGVVSNPCDNRRYDHEGQRRVPNIVIIK